MLSFANRLKDIIPSASMAMSQKVGESVAKGDIIDLTFGQPDFDTPEHIKQAAWKSIQAGHNGYTLSRGIQELREALAEYYRNQYGVLFDWQKEVLVVPGAKQGLMYAIQALINPGDEVILFEPCWLSYRDMILFNGGVPKFIAAGGNLKPAVDQLEENIIPKTKAILLNNPINPSGYVFPGEELERIVQIAIKNDLYVIADEIYDRIVFTEFTSLTQFAQLRDRLILANGFSKAYAMTGWRVAYLLGCEQIISKISLIHQHTATCAAAPSQYAALAALRGNQDSIDAMCRTYQKRRDLMLDGLRDTSFNLIAPQGTFYAMLDVAHLDISVEQKAEKLFDEYGIATVNGVSYGKSAGNYVRLSLTQDEKQLNEVIKRLKQH